MTTRRAYLSANRSERLLIYVIAAVVVIVLAIWAMLAFERPAATPEAQAKADELIAAYEQAELPVPAKDQVVSRLGTDGGAVCRNPSSALNRATLYSQFSNGAAHVGVRPVIVPERVVQGEELILQTYCPDELPAFRNYVGGLKYANTS
jgi:hypothetical protein